MKNDSKAEARQRDAQMNNYVARKARTIPSLLLMAAILVCAIPLCAIDYTVPQNGWMIDSCDLNDDSHQDIIIHANGGIGYLQNNGDGTFAPYEIIIPGTVVLVACCQLDNQAGDDIAVFRCQGGNTVTPLQFEFYYNGDFTDPVVFPFVGDFTLHSSYQFAHGDFSGDGLNDIAVTGFTHIPTNHVYWFYMYNQGNGQFSDPVWWQCTYNGNGDIRVADVNGGGCDDIVLLDSSIFILYSAGCQFITDEIYGNYHYCSVEVADFDLDGDKDLLANSWEGGWNNHHRYYETMGFGNYVLHDQVYQHFWGDMYAARLNADDYPDLISIYGNGFAVFLNQQDWSTELAGSYDLFTEPVEIECVVDRFNGDEYDDIAVVNARTVVNNLKILYCFGDGDFDVNPVSIQDELAPPAFSQISSYPNPFSGQISIKVDLKGSQSQPSSPLCIYNLKGQKIRTLGLDPFNHGTQDLSWDGRDQTGKPCANGIYLLRLDGEGMGVQVRKVTLLRR